MSDTKERLSGTVYDLFRDVFSTSLNQKQVDALHKGATKMAVQLEAIAERKALEKIKEINKEIDMGFSLIEQDVKSIVNDLETITKQTNTMADLLKMLAAAVKDSDEESEDE